MKCIYLAVAVAMAGAWVRGYPAVGAEALMVLVPIVVWALRYQQHREAVARNYQKKLAQEEVKKEEFLHEIRMQSGRRMDRRTA